MNILKKNIYKSTSALIAFIKSTGISNHRIDFTVSSIFKLLVYLRYCTIDKYSNNCIKFFYFIDKIIYITISFSLFIYVFLAQLTGELTLNVCSDAQNIRRLYLPISIYFLHFIFVCFTRDAYSNCRIIIIGVDYYYCFYRHITSDYGWGNAIFKRIFFSMWLCKCKRWFILTSATHQLNFFIHTIKLKVIPLLIHNSTTHNLFDFEIVSLFFKIKITCVIWYRFRFHFWIFMFTAAKS